MKEILTPTNLGIDESNHGRYPEFFVGVYSAIPDDILSHQQLPKHRHKGRTINHAISSGTHQERDFRYMVLPEEIADQYSRHSVTLFIIAELASHYDGLEHIIIDGSRKQKNDIMLIKEMMATHGASNVQYVAKGDTVFPIVNIADEIAYKLFRMHSDRTKKVQDIPIEHEVELDLDRLDYCIGRL